MKASAQSKVTASSAGANLSPVTAAISKSVTSTVELITPQVASEMLARNTFNRPLSGHTVARYAADMSAGRWDYNGQDIIFSDDGTLIDGQHRLSAVVAADVPVMLGIKRGLPSSSFVTIDAGRVRSPGDVLSLMGFTDYNTLAGAARMALSYASGRCLRGSRNGATRREVTDYAVAHPYLVEAVRMSRPLSGRLTMSPVAAVVFLANERRFFDDQIAEFIDGVATGEGLAKGDPRLALREWATNERLRNRGSILSHLCFSATARAWSAWARGEDLKIVKVHRDPRRDTQEIVGFYAPGAAA